MPGDTEQDGADEARVFHHGLALFNRGAWFEAHEAWEEIWRQAGGPRKNFYQGLIQCAVALEHLRRGNPRGVVTVFASAQTRFRGLPDMYMGVNITLLLEQIERLVAPVRALPAERFQPSVARGQTLPVDPAQAPQIELEYDPFATQG
jgi:predicted metal-dependent hydrolase